MARTDLETLAEAELKSGGGMKMVELVILFNRVWTLSSLTKCPDYFLDAISKQWYDRLNTDEMGISPSHTL
jgi:hypothetical protein